MPTPGSEASRPGTLTPALLLRRPWLPALLGLLAFANSTWNDFVYDDRYIILDSPRVRDWTDWRGIWLTDWWKPTEGGDTANSRRDRLYRPLAVFSFALNHALHGYQPAGYHLTNLVLHAVVCWLLWHFAARLTGDAAVSSMAAVLFAVHPVHAEAVANIVGRAEVLSALFLLLGLLTLMPAGGRPGVGRAVLAGLLFLLALLGKETAVCYPALAGIVLSYQLRANKSPGDTAKRFADAPPQRGTRWRWWLAQGVLLAAPLVIYLPVRYIASDRHLIRREATDVLSNPLIPAGLAGRTVGVLTVAGEYVRLLIVPDRLSCDYGIAIIDPRHGVTWTTLLGAAAGAMAIVGLLQWRSRQAARKLVAVLVALVLVSYLLISNSLLLIGVAVAERLMYWPSAPALLLVAVLAVGVWRRAVRSGTALASRPALVGSLGIAILLGLFLRTVTRNTDWRSNMALFTQDVETYPQGAHLNNCCALELLHLYRDTEQVTRDNPSVWPATRRHLSRLGHWPEGASLAEQRAALLRASEWHASRAIAIFPGFLDALALRGRLRAQLGRTEEAERDLQAVLAIDPVNVAVRELRTLLAQAAGRHNRLEELRAAVAAEPERAAPRLALARELIELGQYAAAEQELQEVLQNEPNHVVALHRLADTQLLLDRPEAGRELLMRVVTLDPGRWEAHANLAMLLARSDPPAALRHAQQACQSRPDEPRNVINLAEALALNKRTEEAVRLLEQAVQRTAPDSPLRPILEQRLSALRGR